MSLENPNHGLGGDESPEPAQPHVGCRSDVLQASLDLRRGDSRSVRELDQLPAPLAERVDDLLSSTCLHAGLPVVAVDDVVGAQLSQVGSIVEGALRNHSRDPFQILHDDPSLLEGHVRESLVARDRLVGENSHRYLAQLGRVVDDVSVAGMDEIGAQGHVNFLGHQLIRRARRGARQTPVDGGE